MIGERQEVDHRQLDGNLQGISVETWRRPNTVDDRDDSGARCDRGSMAAAARRAGGTVAICLPARGLHLK
jgi:hypothetical protein